VHEVCQRYPPADSNAMSDARPHMFTEKGKSESHGAVTRALHAWARQHDCQKYLNTRMLRRTDVLKMISRLANRVKVYDSEGRVLNELNAGRSDMWLYYIGATYFTILPDRDKKLSPVVDRLDEMMGKWLKDKLSDVFTLRDVHDLIREIKASKHGKPVFDIAMALNLLIHVQNPEIVDDNEEDIEPPEVHRPRPPGRSSSGSRHSSSTTTVVLDLTAEEVTQQISGDESDSEGEDVNDTEDERKRQHRLLAKADHIKHYTKHDAEASDGGKRGEPYDYETGDSASASGSNSDTQEDRRSPEPSLVPIWTTKQLAELQAYNDCTEEDMVEWWLEFEYDFRGFIMAIVPRISNLARLLDAETLKTMMGQGGKCKKEINPQNRSRLRPYLLKMKIWKAIKIYCALCGRPDDVTPKTPRKATKFSLGSKKLHSKERTAVESSSSKHTPTKGGGKKRKKKSKSKSKSSKKKKKRRRSEDGDRTAESDSRDDNDGNSSSGFGASNFRSNGSLTFRK
jgi:hypothetical protein